MLERQTAGPGEATTPFEFSHSHGHDEQENHELVEALRRTLEAYEQRQRAVAVRIHEQIGQQLFGAQLFLQSAERHAADSAEAAEALDTVRRSLSAAIAETRQLLSQLRLPDLDEFGLVGRIKHLVCAADDVDTRVIEFVHPTDLNGLSPKTDLAAFRIIDELLAAGGRAGVAQNVRIELSAHNGVLRVDVCQSSADPDAAAGVDFGVLETVRDWTTIAGGRMAAETVPPNGARVVAELPLDGE